MELLSLLPMAQAGVAHGDEEEDPQEGSSQGRTQGPPQGLAQEAEVS